MFDCSTSLGANAIWHRLNGLALLMKSGMVTETPKVRLVSQVDRNILDSTMIDFCKGEADTHLAAQGITANLNDGSGSNGVATGGLTGGAFYDRRQNTLFTPANIFWARFNRMRSGGAGARIAVCALQLLQCRRKSQSFAECGRIGWLWPETGLTAA